MEQKENIINQAEELFLKFGVKSVTMDDLCKKLGISKKTLYQIVDDKKSLIREIITQHISTEKKEINSIREGAKNAIDEFLQIAEYVVSLLQKMTPYVLYDLQKYHHESWILLEEFHKTFIFRAIESNLDNGIKEGLYRSTMNTNIIAKLYVAKAMLISDLDMFPPADYNREALFREFVMYHLNGILSAKGVKYISSKNFIKS